MAELKREFPDVTASSIHHSVRYLLEIDLLRFDEGRYLTSATNLYAVLYDLYALFEGPLGLLASYDEAALEGELFVLRRANCRLVIGALASGASDRDALLRATGFEKGALLSGLASLAHAGIVIDQRLAPDPIPHTSTLLRELVA